MVAEREQSPSSTSARQGSVTSNLESPSSSAAASHSAQRERLAAFLQDQAFDVGSGNSDDVGSRQTQHAREQRLKGLVASVDAHFQNVGAGNTSNNTSDGAGNNGSSSNDADTQIRQQPHGQYHARKTGDVRGTGEQFAK